MQHGIQAQHQNLKIKKYEIQADFIKVNIFSKLMSIYYMPISFLITYPKKHRIPPTIQAEKQ